MEPSIWSWGALVLSLLITAAGLITGRNLPAPQRVEHIRKFAAVSAIPLILMMLVPRPYVWRGLPTDRPAVDSITSNDDLPERLTQQAREIRKLQNEVERLGTDLVEVNDYYGRVTSMILTAGLVFCVLYSVRRRKVDGEDVNRTPLGLNDDDNK